MGKAMSAAIDKQVEKKLAHRIKESESEERTKAEAQACIMSLMQSTPDVLPPVVVSSTATQPPTPFAKRQAKVTL